MIRRRSIWFVLVALCIIAGSGMATVMASSNLLLNGDFEGGFTTVPGASGEVANGWTPFVQAAGAAPIFGQGAGSSGYGQSIGGSEPYTAGVFQQISGLEVGRKYKVGVNAYPLPGQDGIAKLVGVDLLGGTDPNGGFIAWSSAYTGDTWMHLSIPPFTAVSESVTIFLRANRTGESVGTLVTFDNAYLTPIYAHTAFLPLIPKSYPVPTATPTVTYTPTLTPTPSATHTPTPFYTSTSTLTPENTSTPTITGTPTATTSITPHGPCSPGNLCWDARLDDLNLSYEQDGSKRYQLIAAFRTYYGSWDDVPEWARQWQDDTLGGDTHAFGLCLDASGNILHNKLFELSWNGGSAMPTAEPNGWANAFIGGPGSTYYPDQGQSGPFSWRPRNGNQLQGLGLPYNLHHSFFGVWQEADPDATPTATGTPTATATHTPTGSAGTPTATPTATMTGVLPTQTPTPTVTGTVESTWQYQSIGIITGQPNCSRTSLGGIISDEGGQPLAGVRVKAWSPEWGAAISEPSDVEGRWEIHVADAPYAGHWQVAVVDAGGQIISPIAGQMYVPQLGGEAAGIPTSSNCSDGHQRLNINWQARSSWTDFVAASARFLSCEENHMNHNIYTWVVDSAGNGINDITLRYYLPSGYTDMATGRDPYKPVGYLDFTMSAHEERRIEVRDYTSDLVESISNTTPPIIDTCGGNAWGHYSYQIVFQASGDVAQMQKRTKLPMRITPLAREPLPGDMDERID